MSGTSVLAPPDRRAIRKCVDSVTRHKTVRRSRHQFDIYSIDGKKVEPVRNGQAYREIPPSVIVGARKKGFCFADAAASVLTASGYSQTGIQFEKSLLALRKFREVRYNPSKLDENDIRALKDLEHLITKAAGIPSLVRKRFEVIKSHWEEKGLFKALKKL